MITIPTRGDVPYYDIQIPLEGVVYTLEFRWNVRANAWFMAILDETGERPYATGLRLVVDWPLSAYTTGRQPPGIFVALDTSNQSRDIEQIDELGARVRLVYISETEMETANAEAEAEGG